MTDRLAEIQALQAKRETAQKSLMQAEARLEALGEKRDDIVAKMAAMNVTPENAEEKLAALIEKRDELLDEAKKTLNGIDLDPSASIL